MPLDAISMTRLAVGHPELSRRIQQVAAICEPQGVTFRVTMVLRTYNEQAALYAQGREDLADVNALRSAVGWAAITEGENNEVTKAEPGYSWHSFGLAADFVPMNGNNPIWSLSDPAWAKVIAAAESCGLASGSKWTEPDTPHLQPQELPVTPTDEDRQDFAAAGQSAVWQKYFPETST